MESRFKDLTQLGTTLLDDSNIVYFVRTSMCVEFVSIGHIGCLSLIDT